MLTVDDVVQGENVRLLRLYADGTIKISNLEYNPNRSPSDIVDLSYYKMDYVFATLSEINLKVGNSIAQTYCHVDDLQPCIYWLKQYTLEEVDKAINEAKARVKQLEEIRKSI